MRSPTKHLALFSICMGFKLIGSVLGVVSPLGILGPMIAGFIVNGFIALFSPMLSNRRLLLLSAVPCIVALPKLPRTMTNWVALFAPLVDEPVGVVKTLNEFYNVFGMSGLNVTVFEEVERVGGWFAMPTVNVLMTFLLLTPLWAPATIVVCDFINLKLSSWFVRRVLVKRVLHLKQFVMVNME